MLIVIGGAGALGSAFIQVAADKRMPTVCVDYRQNPLATHNIPVTATTTPTALRAQLQELQVPQQPSDNLPSIVVCTAGSWQGGPLDQTTAAAISTLTDTNLKPTLLAAGLASLLPGAPLILTSAHASLAGTPAMAAYGAIKAAVNHVALTASAAGIPTVLLMPAVLDTDANREALGKPANNWTPCAAVATDAMERVPSLGNGQLVRVDICTKNGQTSFTVI